METYQKNGAEGSENPDISPRREAQLVGSGVGEGKRVWRLDHRSRERSAAGAESEGGRDAKRDGKQTL